MCDFNTYSTTNNNDVKTFIGFSKGDYVCIIGDMMRGTIVKEPNRLIPTIITCGIMVSLGRFWQAH